jgi:hypothetical protein
MRSLACLFESYPSRSRRAVNIMLGKIGILGIIVLLVSSSGCTMCCHPYDNCGPVFDEASGRSYCSQTRAGSILEGGAAQPAPASSEQIIEESPQGVSSVTQPQPKTESEPRMLSEIDRRAGQTTTTPKLKSTRRPVKQAGGYAYPKTQNW